MDQEYTSCYQLKILIWMCHLWKVERDSARDQFYTNLICLWRKDSMKTLL